MIDHSTHDQTSSSGSWANAVALSAVTWFSALTLPGCGTSQVKSLNDVSNFTVQEDTLSLKTDMSLTADGYRLGSVEQYRMAIRESYSYYDGHGEKLATATKRALSVGVCIDIYDREDVKIGCVSEKVAKSMFSLTTRYFEITDAAGKVLAESAKVEFFGTEIKLVSPEGAQLAVLSRSSLDMGKATWDISTTGDMDKRLLIFIPSFKTHADNSE